MNLQELLDRLDAAGRIRPARLRDIRSALNRYARMLGCGDLRDCPEPAYALPRGRRSELIEEHLKDASPHVLRNVKNNVSFILRQAEELGLIRPTGEDGEGVAPKQFGRRKIGARFPSLMSTESVGYHLAPYSLPMVRWPATLKQQYDDWRRWVTEAKVPRQYPNPRNRRTTIENKTKKFEAFFGYLFNERGIKDLDFEMLTDFEPDPPLQNRGGKFRRHRRNLGVGLLEEFVRWHREQRLGRESAQAREVVSTAGSVARRYYFLKALLVGQHVDAGWFDFLAMEISSFRAKLDEDQTPGIISAERGAVSKAELLRAARAEFPRLNRHSARSSGTELASRAGRALAIIMMVYHPLRNRYYREARLGHELVKKEDGKWYLRFDEGGERKAGAADRTPRELPLSSEVVDYLEQYLEYWRPKLVRKIEDKINRLRSESNGQPYEVRGELEKHKEILFLNTSGGPFTGAGFAQWVQSATYRWLGVRVNPESVRSISVKR